MKHLIETSIILPGFGRGPRYINTFNVNNFPPNKRVNYSSIVELSGKTQMVLFSYTDVDGSVKDLAVELSIPVLNDEFSIRMYIINKLKTILNNVN